jgi:ABC-type uncharacterized transport system permease subunit
MHFFPQSKREWLEFTLFPFKGYTVVAFFCLLVSRSQPRPPHTGAIDAEVFIVLGCVLCFLILFAAGLVQALNDSRRAALLSLGFAAVACIDGMIAPVFGS